ncbi:hypothetical protein AXG93_3072s1030 [Marchantia polymorpha subsp. ruderalis]|uniref:Uncharacterized protein n=1 Tax=Marchantia polymorpha subsp. ruderalis TaxID=1480154 RepID=A0A176WEZ2_MARPO|nr:hypothetical protein AXG93_3072s1030 [Marchantia polymorpha subsp. ruderalis]
MPLLRYLERKVAKYGDRRHQGSYVELVQNRTRTKVATNPVLSSLDNRCRELELKNNALHGYLTLSRKLRKVVNHVRDSKVTKAHKKFEKQREKLEAELDSERAQNSTLAEELVRQTRLLAQRAEAELQLVEIEGNNRRRLHARRVGIAGPRELVATVKSRIVQFVNSELHLELTGGSISHISAESVKFLGMEIKVVPSSKLRRRFGKAMEKRRRVRNRSLRVL